jgi:putative endonuclease
MEYVHVLQSLKDGKLYIGHTGDLKARIQQHNAGENASTKYRRPFKLLCYEACNILEDAIQREKALKTGFGRAYLKRRLGDLKI